MFGGTKPLGVARRSWRALIAALLACVGWSAPALAQCGGTQLCSPGAGDCTIANSCTITVPAAGLQFDLGSRKLVVKGTLTFAGAEDSNVVINAGSFVLDGGTITLPGANQIAGNITINLVTDATVQNNGLIDVSAGIGPGSVDIEALGGDMNFNGRIKANATTRAGDGGNITLFGLNNLTATGTLDASAGDMGLGGEIDLTAQNGAMVVNAPENAAGGDGGDICLMSGTTMQVATGATMMANANGDAGSGGSISLESGGDMTVLADSDGTGSPAASSQDMQSGGDGADVTMLSDNGKLTLSGKIDASAAAGGSGGNLDLEAMTDLTFSKQLFAMSTGAFGFGGDVFLFAGGNLSVPQQVNTSGGTGSGGTFEATALGTVTVSASVITDGTVGGGATVLSGCTVDVTSTGVISALGPGVSPAGTNTLQSGTSMTISGILKAGTQNLLQYRSTPPTIGSKAVIQPAATLELTPSLPCCVNCPVTTTTTTSSTTSTTLVTTTVPTTTTSTTSTTQVTTTVPTTSTTSTTQVTTTVPTTTSSTTSTTQVTTTVPTTTTTLPRGSCGDGHLDPGEQCDDGNTIAGDCCSPSCQFEPSGGACTTDNNLCTSDVCNATGVCTHPAVPDGTSCAPDACTTGAVCSGGTCSGGTEVTCPSCKTCNPSNGRCVVGPLPSCTLPVKSGKSKLGVKISSKGPNADLMSWNWVAGGATTVSEFGNPVASDGLAFCIFDRSQPTPSLLFRAEVAGGGMCGTKPCWVANRDKGFTFASKTGNANGVVGLKLMSGLAGKAKIQLKGKGVALSKRRFGLPKLPLDVPLTAQLQADTGACWQAKFSSTGVNKNDTKQFSGNAD